MRPSPMFSTHPLTSTPYHRAVWNLTARLYQKGHLSDAQTKGIYHSLNIAFDFQRGCWVDTGPNANLFDDQIFKQNLYHNGQSSIALAIGRNYDIFRLSSFLRHSLISSTDFLLLDMIFAQSGYSFADDMEQYPLVVPNRTGIKLLSREMIIRRDVRNLVVNCASGRMAIITTPNNSPEVMGALFHLRPTPKIGFQWVFNHLLTELAIDIVFGRQTPKHYRHHRTLLEKCTTNEPFLLHQFLSNQPLPLYFCLEEQFGLEFLMFWAFANDTGQPADYLFNPDKLLEYLSE